MVASYEVSTCRLTDSSGPCRISLGNRDVSKCFETPLTLNHHGAIPPYANNLRLFEATGVGTLLVTDWKANLHEMFEPGKEVIAYRSAEECAELVKYYLEHDEERQAIARAGQQRTLRDHTHYKRMQRLVEIIQKYL